MPEVLLGFVGDVLINRAQPDEVFGAVREVLKAPHVLFANMEGVYTDDPRPVPSAPMVLSAPAHNLDAYARAGFNVMSLANNHTVDAGYDALLDTRRLLREQGILTCGAGESIADAREPAIVVRDGLRIAFLGYASVFPVGCEARAATPGIVPVRAHNIFREPWKTLHTPGVTPIVTTIADEADLQALKADLERARQRADLVIASFHWGDHTCPFHLTDHEVRTARFCIDHGADLVVGHHHHALRGMEWYRGKPILYGLGHFVFDFHWEWDEEEVRNMAETEIGRYFRRIQFEGFPRKGWPLLPMPDDARLTALAWAAATNQGITDIGFLPCALSPDGLVHPLPLDSPLGQEVIAYVERCNVSQGLNAALTRCSPVTLANFRTLRVAPRSIHR